jgi:hypothetical protein
MGLLLAVGTVWPSVGAAAILEPILSAPANGATGVVAAPVLVWANPTAATSYDVYLGVSSPPPLVASTTATEYPSAALSPGVTYYWQIVAHKLAGTSSSAIWSFTTGVPAVGLGFVPVPPCRVVDTRGPAGPFGAPALAGGSARSFAIPQGACGIPSTAQAYGLNVTVVPRASLTYLTLWPAGQAQPLVSTLNSWDAGVVANAAIVPAGSAGAVSVFASGPTDLILDIDGYFDATTGGASFYSVTPCRVADTRNPTGLFGGPEIFGGQTRDFPIPSGDCGIPSWASAYAMNVTVVPDQSLGYLTVWPGGTPQPNVSTLNSLSGKVVANAAVVPAGSNGTVSVFATASTQLVLDTSGYFGASGNPGALSFYPITPCRVADTRNPDGPFGGPILDAGPARWFTIPASACYVPTTAAAYSLNVTVVPDGPLAYLAVWPAGSPQPLVSTLNSVDGAVVANAAIVPAGVEGAITVYATGPTHVIVDINGYFAP